MKIKPRSIKLFLILLLFGMGVLFNTYSLAKSNWTIEDVETEKEGSEITVNSVRYKGGDDFNLYFFRESKSSKFEKVWMIFDLDESSKNLISSKEKLKVEAEGKDTRQIKRRRGNVFSYRWSPRRVSISIWGGDDGGLYGKVMENVINGGILNISYTSVSGEKINHEIHMSEGSDLLIKILRVDAEVNVEDEKGKKEVIESYNEKSGQCARVSSKVIYEKFSEAQKTGKVRENTKHDNAVEKYYDTCKEGLDICLGVANNDVDLFESCFNDFFDIDDVP